MCLVYVLHVCVFELVDLPFGSDDDDDDDDDDDAGGFPFHLIITSHCFYSFPYTESCEFIIDAFVLFFVCKFNFFEFIT